MISERDIQKTIEYLDDVKIVFHSSVIKPEYIGAYFGNKLIVIHRFNLLKPNNSYTQDLVFILHEYGHHKLKIPDTLLSKTGYRYFHKQSKLIVFKEEVFAWAIAFKTILLLPLKWYKKLYILFYTFCLSWIAINTYELYP